MSSTLGIGRSVPLLHPEGPEGFQMEGSVNSRPLSDAQSHLANLPASVIMVAHYYTLCLLEEIKKLNLKKSPELGLCLCLSETVDG